MTNDKIDMFITAHAKDFEMEAIPQVKALLEKVPEDKYSMILGMDLKNPTTMLLISLFVGVFGVDRFMLGEIGLGVLKLITGGGLGIWAVIDWITVMKRTRKNNYNELVNYLNTVIGV